MKVRAATLDDLDALVQFTTGEAREAEGSQMVPETLARGIRTALEDPGAAAHGGDDIDPPMEPHLPPALGQSSDLRTKLTDGAPIVGLNRARR